MLWVLNSSTPIKDAPSYALARELSISSLVENNEWVYRNKNAIKLSLQMIRE